MRNKKQIIILGLLLFIGGISILAISIIKQSKFVFAYIASAIMLLIFIYIFIIVLLDDSISKKKMKLMVEELKRNQKILNYTNIDSLYGSVFLTFENITYTYVEVLNKHISIAKYDMEETNKIKEANNITNPSLKQEALYNIMKNKKFIKYSIKGLSPNDIINLINEKIKEGE